MARVVKPISIDDELEKDILDKLNSVPNRSAYVKELIKADLNKKPEVFTDKQKEAIKDIVKKILANYEITIDNDSIKKDQEILDGIDGLMG